MSRTTVREARAILAEALLEDDDLAAAEEELRFAMDAPGDRPTTAALLGSLARVALRRHEIPEAVALLSVALSESNGTAEVSAQLNDIFSSSDEQIDLRSLGADVVARIIGRAGEPDAPADLLRVATRLHLLRGNPVEAGLLVENASGSEVGDDPDLQSVRQLARAWTSLENGDSATARRILDGEPRHDVTRVLEAFASYCEGDLDTALSLVDTPSSYLGAVVRSLTLLRCAVDRPGEEPRLRDEALSWASEAARIDPSRPDALLLRAQVALESDDTIPEGRRLLGRAIDIDVEPTGVDWWRLQANTRLDDSFRFVQLEVAAEMGDHDKVRSFGESIPLATTSFYQDAEMSERVGRAHVATDGATAASFFRQAASAHLRRSPAAVADALDATRAAQRLDPTTRGAFSEVELVWRSTHELDGSGADAAELLQGAISQLDALDPALDTRNDRLHAAYLRGLVLVRQHAVVTDLGKSFSWDPVPWLLVAALGSGTAYQHAHAAWALDGVGLNRAAMHFADVALALDQSDDGDPWLTETVIVMRFNWAGRLDPEARELLVAKQDDDWRRSIELFAALLSDGDGPTSASVPAEPEPGWQRQIAASEALLSGDTARADVQLRAALDDGERSGDPEMILWAATLLRDHDRARRALDHDAAQALMNDHEIRFQRHVIDLLETGSSVAADEASAIAATLTRPFRLRTLLHIDLPTTRIVHADRSDVATGLDQVIGVVRDRVRTVEQQTPDSLFVEQWYRPCHDPRLHELTFALLDAATAPDAEQRRRSLRSVADTVDGPMGAAIGAAAEPPT